MKNGLYPFFWQHGEDHAVLSEYMDKISESGMKGVCIEARPHPAFVGNQWWSDLDLILAKAKEHEMKVWILDDSHFPTGYANGKIKESYPQYLKKYLDMRRYDVQGPMRRMRIDLKLLKGRPWDKPDPDEKIWKVYLSRRISQYTENDDAIDAGTLTDITEHMDMKNRLLTLDVPNGAYSIFILYLTAKGGEEATKDYLNPLIKEATEILIQEVYEPHYEHYKEWFGTLIEGFFSDEPRFGNIKGTEAGIGCDMVLPWKEGLENELDFDLKYLPLLWIKAGGKEAEIRYQYMELITKMYRDNFTKVLSDWCHAHHVKYLGHTIEDNGAHARLGYGTGHYFRGQETMDYAGIDVIGGQIVPGMNYHHDAFNTGGSNGEFYHYALAKLASSAAHLDPLKKGCSMCEAFGAYGWNEGLKMMKWITDHLIVRGINHLVPHAFNPKEFPDFDCPPHFYAHGKNPQFRYFSVFSDYANRLMAMFRDGKHPAKVGILYPAELEWGGNSMPVEKPARMLTENQISFDILSSDYLEKAEITEKSFCINGQVFEVMIVPYGAFMPEKIAALLSRLEDAGVKVIRLTENIHSFHPDEELLQYRAIRTASALPELAVGEYIKDGRNYLMLFNENIGAAIKSEIRIPGEGYLYRYDAFTDRLTKASHKMTLHLAPYESTLFIQSGEELDHAEDCTVHSSEDITEQLPKQWNVSFAESTVYPNFTMRVPTDCLEIISSLDGFDHQAGTVRYEASMNFHPEDANYVIDLGNVYETAEIFVNQASAGVRLCMPYQFDVTSLLREGENQIAIEITNTLGTQIRDAISHYLPIEPFGIEGPVKFYKNQ
ncbi:hypothetical protein D7X88_00250 [bacterium C-53]|nr:hypothetical protein [Lachnospiraceae bacterium]NBI01449.1 hypothetical protein [Lachnospiraceae bacterium]RKJ12761.1 hypothetical protein D7X88_00250 [bacterium C-53]